MLPKDVHNFTSKRMTINLHRKKDSDLRTLKGQDYPGTSRCAHSNHMGPLQAMVTGRCERRRENPRDGGGRLKSHLPAWKTKAMN